MLSLLWAGYWGAATWSLRAGIAAWLDMRQSEGWQAEADLETTGFPATIAVGLTDLALADPDTGLAIAAARVDLSARTIWPADVTVALPDTPIIVATPQGRGALEMQDGVLALDTYPGTTLALAQLGWTGAAWSINGPAGALIEAASLTLTFTHAGGMAYDLHAAAPRFAPGAALRTQLRIPAAWPAVFDVAEAQGRIAFDRPWDRRALDDRRPQPVRIDIDRAEARWGDLRLRLAAALDVDARGVPTGTVNLRADNWPVMLDLAQTAGLLDSRTRPQAEAVLTRLASLGGRPDSLDVQLNFAAGLVAVGFIPVGPAPRLVLR
ncbi:MAG: DUF2125 domain-containing protein [Pseudomonadota bacterium]